MKRWFAQRLLPASGGRRATVPAALAGRLAEMAAGWVGSLPSLGVTVHGDLADLRPAAVPGGPHPDDVSVDELWGRTPELIADLLAEVARLREPAGPGDDPLQDERAGGRAGRLRLPLGRRKA